jgi:hypothetical protein
MKQLYSIQILLVAVCTLSWGTTYYVSQSVGTNGNGTSWANAWKELNTISWAAVNPGDTVKIGSGTYTTALTLSKAGTSSNRIRIMRAADAGHNGKVTLTGSMSISQPFSASVGVLVTQPYITVDGIDKNLFEFNTPGISHILVNVSTASDYFEIKNAVFTNTPDGACWMRSIHVASGSLFIDHCEFKGSQCQEDIISYKSTGAKLKIQNSIFRNWVSINGSHSDMVEGGTSGNPQSDSLIFTYNLVDDNVTNGHNICFMMYNTFNYVDMSYNVFKDVYQVLQGTYRAGRIVNNTFFRTAGEGGGGVTSFGNNIFADDATLTSSDRYNWEKYSLFHNTYYDHNFSSTPDADGNLSGDPKFLNPESILGGDSTPFTADDGFNLLAGSAAIDKGSNVGIPADIRGTAIAGNPDIGAYEYSATAKIAGVGLRSVPAARPLLPNPVKAALLKQYVLSRHDLELYDLSGTAVPGGSIRYGVYVIRDNKNAYRQKIMAIQ